MCARMRMGFEWFVLYCVRMRMRVRVRVRVHVCVYPCGFGVHSE